MLAERMSLAKSALQESERERLRLYAQQSRGQHVMHTPAPQPRAPARASAHGSSTGAVADDNRSRSPFPRTTEMSSPASASTTPDKVAHSCASVCLVLLNAMACFLPLTHMTTHAHTRTHAHVRAHTRARIGVVAVLFSTKQTQAANNSVTPKPAVAKKPAVKNPFQVRCLL